MKDPGDPISGDPLSEPFVYNELDPEDSVGADDMAAERSLVDDVRALVDDGKLLAEAELDFQKKRARFVAQEAKGISASFIAAAVFGFFALMALTVGLVLALGQSIGFWASTAVVAGVLLLIALLCALRGRAKIQRVSRVLSAEGKTGHA